MQVKIGDDENKRETAPKHCKTLFKTELKPISNSHSVTSPVVQVPAAASCGHSAEQAAQHSEKH
jgi:hypothetical protein